MRRIAEAGAVHVTPIVLHLRPGRRDWYLRWLNENHPALLPRYRALYGRGSYAPKDYQAEISGRIRELARRYGVGATTPAGARSVGARRGMGPIRREPDGRYYASFAGGARPRRFPAATARWGSTWASGQPGRHLGRGCHHEPAVNVPLHALP